jgi:hypothetical protein
LPATLARPATPTPGPFDRADSRPRIAAARSRTEQRRTAEPRARLLIALAALACAACATAPSGDHATIRTEAPIHPPLLGLDFWSAEPRIVERDGTPAYLPPFYDAVLAPGRHTVTVEVAKGPTGMFGVAPLLGTCRGQVQIDAVAGRGYVVRYKREQDDEVLEVSDREAGAVLVRVPCVPSGGRTDAGKP